MSSNRSKRTSRNKRRRNSRRPEPRFTLPWKATLASIAGLVAFSAGGYFVYQDMNTVKPDDKGCYSQLTNQAFTAALIDVSDPGFDEVQSRDAITAFSNLFRYELGFNEKFAMVTTAQSKIGSVAAPVVTLCAPAKSSSDLENIGAASATQAYVDRQIQVVFEKQLKPHLDTIFATNPADVNRQRNESPILEQIQSVSRMRGFRNGGAKRRLILVSDLLQNVREVQFCHKQGHLPSFKKFKTKPYFQQIKPLSLKGVDVQVYMLIRGELGKPPYAYCTETELRNFWVQYFEDAGASNVDIIRLRRGGI